MSDSPRTKNKTDAPTYYQRNAERLRAYQRERRKRLGEEFVEKSREYQRNYRAAMSEEDHKKDLERQSRYREEHREELRANGRARKWKDAAEGWAAYDRIAAEMRAKRKAENQARLAAQKEAEAAQRARLAAERERNKAKELSAVLAAFDRVSQCKIKHAAEPDDD